MNVKGSCCATTCHCLRRNGSNFSKWSRINCLYLILFIRNYLLLLLATVHLPKKNSEILFIHIFYMYSRKLKKNSFLSRQIDTVYLDTTYCRPEYDFPAQDLVIEHTNLQVQPVQLPCGMHRFILICMFFSYFAFKC